MKKIASFTVNHLELIPGLYVSRLDKVGDNYLTTFDIRITRPNFEPVIDNPALHAIEHLGATFLRNHKVYKNDIIYFGPMGCRTGFYFIVRDNISHSESIEIMKKLVSAENIYLKDTNGVEGTAIHTQNIDVVLDMSGAIDKEEEKAKLEAELKKAEGELKRAESMLSNEKFVSKAPAALIEAEKEKVTKYTEIIAKLKASFGI